MLGSNNEPAQHQRVGLNRLPTAEIPPVQSQLNYTKNNQPLIHMRQREMKKKRAPQGLTRMVVASFIFAILTVVEIGQGTTQRA